MAQFVPKQYPKILVESEVGKFEKKIAFFGHWAFLRVRED